MARLLGGIGADELIAILWVAAAGAVPFITHDLFVYSTVNQILIGLVAALSVYVMLQMDLLTFATPPFMALGGYAVAIVTMRLGITNVFVLAVISFVVPALVAIPLGPLVLRLRGTYFVLVTFVLSEILQLIIFLTPALTGGSNGLVGFPSPTLFGISLSDNQSVLLLATGLALLAIIITAVATSYFRQHFSAIKENEALAESLGLVIWRDKSLGFIISAGGAGLAGFALVNMLLTAHPSSFSSVSAVNYIAYTIVGGRSSLLGTTIGAALLVFAANLLGGQGEYSEGLYGLLIIAAVLAAKGGLAGTLKALVRRLSAAPQQTASPGSVKEAQR